MTKSKAIGRSSRRSGAAKAPVDVSGSEPDSDAGLTYQEWLIAYEQAQLKANDQLVRCLWKWGSAEGDDSEIVPKELVKALDILYDSSSLRVPVDTSRVRRRTVRQLRADYVSLESSRKQPEEPETRARNHRGKRSTVGSKEIESATVKRKCLETCA